MKSTLGKIYYCDLYYTYHITDEFEHIVRNSGATWIAVGAGLEKTALEVAQRVGNIKEIFVFEGQAEGCSLFQELLDDTGDLYAPHTQVRKHMYFSFCLFSHL